ncbi:GPI mannosyltransferase 2 [Microsporum canis CBS 113480]|uniref:GPI mannosyltransferase 2 n=1 Tax=Arthroderma otae (strain ATCC MYA-4605 / CBS 113480) TaxID=554155 RepID=C5FUH6_ARTOC|nr:GPI mannosyltransferase 2 [Microsporum canis CBS 113480]EEQ33560.1 GPI mannosyltransferase 2 [Microsporum canis CBS 113480]
MPSPRMTTRAIDSIGALDQPIYTLTKCFCLWKMILLLVVLASPGLGYDTSTALLLSPEGEHVRHSAGSVAWMISRVGYRLARWDSIYFLKLAQRGYVFEQEWAFGYGYTRFLSFLLPGSLKSLQHLAVAGVILSHLCHYLSVLVLYKLSQATFKSDRSNSNALPFLASALHIITPAGAFLSAPNGEAPFSFLNFLGYYTFITGLNDERQGSYCLRDLKLLSAGALFAAATTVRSNGLLSGLLFVYDAVFGLQQIITHGLSWHVLRRLAMGSLGRNMWHIRTFAWQKTRVRGAIVYFQVSTHGFSPVTATPMICALVYSGVRAWARLLPIITAPGVEKTDSNLSYSVSYEARLALPQVVLAVLAVTHYHIQIVNRISSGYPLWYWFLASCLVREKRSSSILPPWITCHAILRVMIIHVSIIK